jgi:hypothetical protein
MFDVYWPHSRTTPNETNASQGNLIIVYIVFVFFFDKGRIYIVFEAIERQYMVNLLVVKIDWLIN